MYRATSDGPVDERIFCEIPDVPFRDHVAGPRARSACSNWTLTCGRQRRTEAARPGIGRPRGRHEVARRCTSSTVPASRRDLRARASELEFPAATCSRTYRSGRRGMDDPVTLAELDRHNIHRRSLRRTTARPRRVGSTPTVSVSTSTRRRHGSAAQDRSRGRGTTKCVRVRGLYPQVAINDEVLSGLHEYIRLTSRSVDRECPRPRIPYAPPDARISTNRGFFPRAEVRPGMAASRGPTRGSCSVAEPLLSTTAFAEVLPEGIIDFANTPRRRQVIFSGYFPPASRTTVSSRVPTSVPRPRVAQVPAYARVFKLP
jgi:hypothetical protein